MDFAYVELVELSRTPAESMGAALARVNRKIDEAARIAPPPSLPKPRPVAAPTRVVGKRRGAPPPWWDPQNRDVWAELTK